MRDELVFLSYARGDQEAARRLYSALSSAGIKVWFDVVNLLPGQQWQKQIREIIASCSHFVALLSSESIERRGYVQSELRHAIGVLSEIPEGEIFLIPARLNECHVPYEDLRSLHWVDLFPSFDNGVQRIISAVKATRPSAPKKELQASEIASAIDLIDVRNVGGGAFAWIDSEEPLLQDDRSDPAAYFESLEHKPRLPLVTILENPGPGAITSMTGTACAFSFHLVLKPRVPWAIIRPPHVVVNRYEPVPKYRPAYPAPVMNAHIHYVEIDAPAVCGRNVFTSKYLVHTREEKTGRGSFCIYSATAELTPIRLIPNVPEFFVVRVNAITPGVYQFDVAVEVRISDSAARIPIREGCKYLFVTR